MNHTFEDVIRRYLVEELPPRFSTRRAYEANIRNHIRPRWGACALAAVRPFAVEQWLRGLQLAPKSRGHLRSLLHLMLQCAMRWEWLPLEANPMRLVRVEGVSKRQRIPRVLTAQQIQRLAATVNREPYVTMIWTAACLGLTASELSGLRWADVDFKTRQVFVRRGVIAGRIERVKTIYRAAALPLAPRLVRILRSWRARSRFTENEDWVFANPFTKGLKPYNAWNVQTLRLRPAARALGLEGVSWHALRHSYSTLLRQMQVDLKVHQALLRHADIRTTLQIYTQPVAAEMRTANLRLAARVLSSV